MDLRPNSFNIIARSRTAPRILELGISFAYSTLWLADAARAAGGRVTTSEAVPEKSARARHTMSRAELSHLVDFRVGNALEIVVALDDPFDIVLLDLWKDLYVPCLDPFYPKLAPGAIIVADNMLRPGGPLMRLYADAIRAKPGIEIVLLRVGTGVEVSRYRPEGSKAPPPAVSAAMGSTPEPGSCAEPNAAPLTRRPVLRRLDLFVVTLYTAALRVTSSASYVRPASTSV